MAKLVSRISPIWAWLPCTARLISGALYSDALLCSVIFSLPSDRVSTSLTKEVRFSTWKLLAG
ncbi:hypothetical protein D3C77_754730 [compost metagenome]